MGKWLRRLTQHCRFDRRATHDVVRKSNHEADVPLSIRQARRAKAHRRRQCQTLGDRQVLKIINGGWFM